MKTPRTRPWQRRLAMAMISVLAVLAFVYQIFGPGIVGHRKLPTLCMTGDALGTPEQMAAMQETEERECAARRAHDLNQPPAALHPAVMGQVRPVAGGAEVWRLGLRAEPSSR